MLKELIEKLLRGEDLSAEESRAAIEAIMGGDVSPVHIASFLTALRQKGETAGEIEGAARAMREKAQRVPHHQTMVFDNCGTGGDGTGTFNISTTTAFVLAGCGLAVAKHGNRSVSSRSGSADVLAALGAKITLAPEQVGQCLDTVGIGFLFAPLLHPAMKNVAPVRQELGFRTVFNLLGPLTNPAFATHQLIGVYAAGPAANMALAARGLGIKNVCVVCCERHIDEVTTAGVNHVLQAVNGSSREFTLEPEEYGYDRCTLADLQGGIPEENAAITRAILQSRTGPCRDTVILNAAVSLLAAEHVGDVAEGIAEAEESIDSGRALAKLNEFIQFTNDCADA